MASSTQRQSKRPWALWPRAPGSSPARVSTWNPLQMPMTGPPRTTKSRSACAEPAAVGRGEVEGEQPSGAEGVAVAEPAGDDHDVVSPQRRRVDHQLVDEHRVRLGAGEGQGQGDVAVAVRARTGQHERARTHHWCTVSRCDASQAERVHQ